MKDKLGMPATFGDWTSEEVPAIDRCVLGPVLERWVRDRGEKVLVRFTDGTEWTYAQTLIEVRRIADGLRRLGVKHGDRVVSWLPNGPDQLRIWWALNYLGAVFVPVNLAYKGRLLEHVIANSQAELIVLHHDLALRLEGIRLHGLRRAIVIDGDASLPASLAVLPESALDGDPAAFSAAPDVKPWDTQWVIYTSGTTGPSKGVLTSFVQTHAVAEAIYFEDENDREMVVLPMFHIAGSTLAYGMLLKGASMAIVDAFDTREFWRVVRETRCTVATILGQMMTFLLNEPPGPDDRNHTLRKAMVIPLGEQWQEFGRRFGVEVHTAFNMTEISVPLISDGRPMKTGMAGRLRPGVEVRLVDDNDIEVPVGEFGELIVRTKRPWAMNHGYNGNPEATVAAWRNGWFHTGDLFWRDADNTYFFADRKKDALRRRGENISSFEVEQEIMAHPAVYEVAVVAVPNESSEDEVLAVVTLRPGHQLNPAQLIEFLLPRMAHFMVPRYIRVVDALPKTPTQKVEKYILRKEGVTADTWDREQAGIQVKRERIGAARAPAERR